MALTPASPATDIDTRFDRALASIAHRGPDANGRYREGNVLLGHARLSIIDLSDAGRQPMATADGRYVISYNGEVYNFRELMREHAIEGLRSHSDTEIVLRLFEQRGPASLPLLNGMFAFAIHDVREQKLWLVRDRLGIKPLYYRLDSRGLCFASEIKAIVALSDDAPACDISVLHEWLYYGNPLGGHTLYQGIKQLLPGTCLELDLRTFQHKVHTYWSLEEQLKRSSPPPGGVREAVDETTRLLEQAVQRQLVGDVPVGVFLSGGVDSSAIAAFASRHYEGKLATYCAGFDFAKGEGELPRARRVAQALGTDHHEIHIRGGDIGQIVEKLVHHHDMPFADAANIPLYLMAANISEHTKVVLQGDGGDELFGGYSRYFTLGQYWLLRPAARLLQHLHAFTPQSAFHYRARRYLRAVGAEDMATAVALLLTPEDRSLRPTSVFGAALRAEVEKADPFARHRACLQAFAGVDRVNLMSCVDLAITLPDTFLEKVDRSTMAASLEVRVPFLDHDLVDFAVSVPGSIKAPSGRRKWLLKTALQGIVPDEVLTGPKAGLEVPYGAWLQGPLRDLFFDHLERFDRAQRGVLDVARVTQLYKDTGAGGRDDSYMLWKVMNLMIWANDSKVRFDVERQAR